MAPALRRFRIILSLEVILFLLAALTFALSYIGKLPSLFQHGPLFFIVQLVVLYLLRLSLRQTRFLIHALIYVLLIGAQFSAGGLYKIALSLTLFSIAVGAVLTWWLRIRTLTTWARIQTLWLGLLVASSSLSIFFAIHPIVLPEMREQGRQAAGVLVHYSPWGTLAGWIVTLAVRAALRAGRRGISPVRQDFYPEARLAIPEPRTSDLASILAVAAVAALQIIERMRVLFWNSMVTVLNAITRVLVIVWQVVVTYVSGLWEELRESGVIGYVSAVIRRVLIPLLAVYVIACLSVEMAQLLRRHTCDPAVTTGIALVWKTLLLWWSMAASVMCFAETHPLRFFETYCRDSAVVCAYGIALLPACMLALWLISESSSTLFETDLRLQMGPLSWACVLVLVCAAVFLWKNSLATVFQWLRNAIEKCRP